METAAISYADASDRRLSRVPLLLTLALLLWWLLSFVDSAFQQAQMAIFAENIVAPKWSMDALMLCVLAWMLLQRGWQPQLPTTLLVAWFAFGFCLIVSAIFLEARFGDVLDDLAVTYYRFYFLIMVLPFATALEGSFNTRFMEFLLLVIALPLGGLGLYQYIENDPILPTAAVGNTWQAFAWKLDEQVRAFSLFNSGWTFGHFNIFVALIALFMSFKRRIPPLLGIALFAACAGCVYICRTRTAYLVGGGALTTALLLLIVPRAQRERLLAMIPLLWLFVAYLVASGIKDILHFLGIGEDNGVLSSASLDARHEAWAQWTDVWFHDATNALFGAAVTQRDSGQLMSESTVLIDNVYIAIGAQIGLIGLILWLFFIWRIWRFMLAETLQRDDALSWAAAAVWATWPLSLMFGSGGAYYALLALLVMLTRQPRVALSLARHQSPPLQFGQQRVRQQPVAGEADVGVVRQEQILRP